MENTSDNLLQLYYIFDPLYIKTIIFLAFAIGKSKDQKLEMM